MLELIAANENYKELQRGFYLFFHEAADALTDAINTVETRVIVPLR